MMRSISFFCIAYLALVIAMCGQSLADTEIIDVNELCRAKEYLGACLEVSYLRGPGTRCAHLLCATSKKLQSVHVGTMIEQPPNGTYCNKNKICKMGICEKAEEGDMLKNNGQDAIYSCVPDKRTYQILKKIPNDFYPFL